MPAETTVYGKYRLIERLARGGMAEVFRAKSHGVEGFEKVLVIKRILPELTAHNRFVEMFINEAKIAVTLSHANIVQVFDLGQAEGSYFIAMEYVAGYDLATVLGKARKQDRPLPPELAVYIASEVAKGLDYAHRRKDAALQPLHIVHRDVSPQNVLLSYEGEVKLTDFGIAKARHSVQGLTDAGQLKGKYAYMAPEQARGEAVDARTDLFSLGACLYQALTGVSPFLGKSDYETLTRVREARCEPLRLLIPHIPHELSSIVERALSVDPNRRQTNAGSLYEELIQFLYSSGRRVGAHDLARYIEELRTNTQSMRPPRPGDDSGGLRMAFEPTGEQVHHTGPDATPAESPSARTGPGRPAMGTGTVSIDVGPRTLPLERERQDVTVLSVLTKDGATPAELPVLVDRHGGQVLERGDHARRTPLLAMFGAREIDGRDIEAAARCATQLVVALGEKASAVRIGLHTGRLLAEIHGDLVQDREYNDLLHAARLLATSAPDGKVLASSAAERTLRLGFELELHPGHGFLVGSEQPAGRAQSRFVGRRDELRRIGEIFALANRGKRRILAVLGEPGSGKSRLLLETERRLRLGGHDVGMVVAHLTPQMREAPLSGVHELLRVILGIDEANPQTEVEAKVQRLRELGLAERDQHAVAAALGLPVAVPGTTSGSRGLQTALSRMASKLAEDRLTVFVLDGVESLDDESREIIDGLLRDVTAARFAVVFAHRPTFANPWRDLPGFYEVVLAPLRDADVERLITNRLGVETIPEALLREVTAKSAGTPLYIEEYVKALEDAAAVRVHAGLATFDPNVAEVEVPRTLRGIVAAKLGRLDPGDRRLLQVGAIAGPRFSVALLAQVIRASPDTVTTALGRLESRGIVVKHGTSDFAFAFDLLAEVIRDGLPLDARRDLHRAVAQALEAVAPQRVEEMAERLAEHYRLAGDRDKASEYWMRAANRLEAEGLLEGAIAHLSRAMDQVSQAISPDRDRLLDLHRRVGDLSYRARDLDKGAARLDSAIEIAEALGREEHVARFSMMKGRLLVAGNQFVEGRLWLDRARSVAKNLANNDLLRDVTLVTAEAEARNGEYSKAIGLLEEVLGLARDTGDTAAQLRALILLSLAHAITGAAPAATDALREAQDLSAHADRYTQCEILKTESIVHHYARDFAHSLDASTRALDLAKEYGYSYEAAVNAHNLGETLLHQGDYKRAYASLHYSWELAREHGFEKVEMINLRVLGFIDAVQFRSDEGYRRIRAALEYAQTQGYVWDQIQAAYMLAIADHELGNLDAARQGLRSVLRLSAEHGNRRSEEEAEVALAALEGGDPAPIPGGRSAIVARD